MNKHRMRRLKYIGLAALLLPFTAMAQNSSPAPVVAIIIDDLGNKMNWGKRALQLPGPVAMSFLPHAPHTGELAKRAHSKGKEIMLHLPMQAMSGHKLGPGGLTLQMTKQQLQQATRAALDSVPHVSGLNNHMGSLLTRHPGAMRWLMDTIKEYGDLFFIDSRTTGKTVALKVASEQGVRTANRDVFLDNVRSTKAIRKQFRQLLRKAKRQGFAIGIGHPYPETIKVLKQELPALSAKGIRLISVSQLAQQQEAGARRLVSLPGSNKVAKKIKDSELLMD